MGEKFDTWDDFALKLSLFSKSTNQTFVINDSKTVKAANKVRDAKYPECLKYGYVKYVCYHYGDNRVHRNRLPTGARPAQRYSFWCILFTQ